MPVVHVHLIEGYDDATRMRLAGRISDAVLATVAADPASVVVFVHEVAASGYMRGGRSAAGPAAASQSGSAPEPEAGPAAAAAPRPGAARPDAEALVRAYLAEMEARDLQAAQKRLAEGFTMTFPGGATFRRPAELVDWAASRYRRVGKVVERTESVLGGEHTVVWCFGTLFGVWPDGSPFEGIRFVDRFTVRDGLIVDQLVWNDLAELRSGG